ncbi:hypothetical protein GCM10011393_09240 [Sphingopyxis bauzanensis]|nr:hypothetical protein GCM10011393_09240 [Sphingopyxis bauzanensis]
MLAEFKGLGRLWLQPPERLSRILADWPTVQAFLASVHDAMFEGMRSGLRSVPIDPFDPALRRYLIASMGSLPDEMLRVLFLDAGHRLIADEPLQQGTLTQLAIYPRTIFRRALEHNAAAIILVHNHPSGDHSPSAEDVATTQRLDQLGRALGVEILDHIIVTAARTHHLIAGDKLPDKPTSGWAMFFRSDPCRGDAAELRALRNAEITFRRRILRNQLLGGSEHFGEPAWDIILDLFIHEAKGQRLSMSALCVTAAIPTSSAMKLIQRMCDDGILERSPDLADGRRSLINIAPAVSHRLRAYFAEGTE